MTISVSRIAVSQMRDPDCRKPSMEFLRRLMAEIVSEHHAYLKRELPVIESLLTDTTRAEPGRFGQTASALFPVFLRFRQELEAHMKREEITLFPLIERLEVAIAKGEPAPRNSFGPLSNAIQFMNEDHEFENKLLGMMAEISEQFSTPPGAPDRYGALMGRLQALKLDLDEHVRKEDEMLFPEAIRLEESDRRNH